MANEIDDEVLDELSNGKKLQRLKLKKALEQLLSLNSGGPAPEATPPKEETLLEFMEAAPLNPDELRIFVLRRDKVIALAKSGGTIPVFQELCEEGALVRLKFSNIDALRGSLRNVLAVSYSWQGRGDPDSTRDRLLATAAFLETQPQLAYVWWDYPCLPQTTESREKTEAEDDYFKAILNGGGVNIIYLGAKVLSILTSLYTQRFWTQFEYILANRFLTADGFQFSPERSSAVGIQSLKGSGASQAQALSDKWAHVSTEDAVDMLGQPDVTVTNASDKEDQLGKLGKLNGEVQAALKEGAGRLDA